MKLTGKHINGMGIANKSISAQKNFLLTYEPRLQEIYDGTINILLDVPLFISNPDIKTGKLQWSSDFPPESFALTEIKITLCDKNEIDQQAWIYEAEFSPHRANPYVVEILAVKLEYLSGTQFEIEVLHADIKNISAVLV